MMNFSEQSGSVLTEESADFTAQRVALAALMYYPGIEDDQPNYTLDGDVTWVLEELVGSVDEETFKQLRELVRSAIVDPTLYRREVFSTLMELADADSGD